jgi:SOS-response transcriptional repressor LexA
LAEPTDEFDQRTQRCILAQSPGMSMKDAGILDKDLVIVKQQKIADINDIVVALLEDEATVKAISKKRQGFI